jgi:AhpD family alkylhydroperoxidase
MDWQHFLDDMNHDLAALRPQISETMKGFGAMARAASAPGTLDAKTKELLALAIGVAVHCDPCIGFHAKAARQAGASREEVAEAIGMCVYMGGGPALMYGAKAMAAFDAFAEQG